MPFRNPVDLWKDSQAVNRKLRAMRVEAMKTLREDKAYRALEAQKRDALTGLALYSIPLLAAALVITVVL